MPHKFGLPNTSARREAHPPLLRAVLAAAHAARPGRVVALTPFTANVLVSLGITPLAVGQPGAGEEPLDPIATAAVGSVRRWP